MSPSVTVVSNPSRPFATRLPNLKVDASIAVVTPEGRHRRMDLAAVDEVVRWACAGVVGVDAELIMRRCHQSLRGGMQAAEVGHALVMAVRPLIATGPGYSQVCARLLLDSLWGEVRAGLGRQTAHGGDFRAVEYPALFEATICTGVGLGLLAPDLLEFDLPRLGQALKPERDKSLTFQCLQLLHDHHLLQSRGTRLELPQSWLMRMAMGLASAAEDRDSRAIELYDKHSAIADMNAGAGGVSVAELARSSVFRPGTQAHRSDG